MPRALWEASLVYPATPALLKSLRTRKCYSRGRNNLLIQTQLTSVILIYKVKKFFMLAHCWNSTLGNDAVLQVTKKYFIQRSCKAAWKGCCLDPFLIRYKFNNNKKNYSIFIWHRTQSTVLSVICVAWKELWVSHRKKVGALSLFPDGQNTAVLFCCAFFPSFLKLFLRRGYRIMS